MACSHSMFMQQGTVCAHGKHAAAAVSDTCGGSWAARHHGFGGELYLLCGMPKTDIALHSSSKSAPLGCSGDPNCLHLSPRPQNTSRHHQQLQLPNQRVAAKWPSAAMQVVLGGSGGFKKSVVGGWDGGCAFARSAQGRYLLVPRSMSRHDAFFCRRPRSPLQTLAF